MAVSRGIKKLNENVLSEGRAIIVTENDTDKYKWAEIPNGSKFINTKTGIEKVKLEGETDWVPAGVKNDGTICIAKDSIISTEVFTVLDIKPDEDGNFSYVNAKGEVRHMPVTEDGYIFELEEGSYYMLRNHLQVTLDDAVTRTAASGGVIELNGRRFALTGDLHNGEEITVTYIRVMRIGNPYPRIFVGKEVPTEAEEGDWWLDMSEAPYKSREVAAV